MFSILGVGVTCDRPTFHLQPHIPYERTCPLLLYDNWLHEIVCYADGLVGVGFRRDVNSSYFWFLSSALVVPLSVP